MHVCVCKCSRLLCVCVFEIYHFLRFHNTTLLINGSQFDLTSLQTPPANSAHCAAYVEAVRRRRRPSILLYFLTLFIFFFVLNFSVIPKYHFSSIFHCLNLNWLQLIFVFSFHFTFSSSSSSCFSIRFCF